MKRRILSLILLGNLMMLQPQDLLIVDGKPFFASGMNLAWMNFANDLNSFNATLFTQRCDQLSAAGGNSLRWWLHTNGTSSPLFTNDTVSGISVTEINNLKRALDTAYKRNIRLILCLWSFDMLQPNAGNAWTRNKKLLEDSIATAAYIRNALIPMVNAVKGHPGILCWEVFNEPEGMTTEFGWSPYRTTMAHIQAFTNRVAGAIHRHDPEAKVSNGSWNIKVLTDVDGKFNYYRDDRLIAAGKDSLGTLDFYMVHYYNVHFGVSESPFHKPKSYWQLDKPLVIAEFPALGLYGGQLATSISPIEAYNYAYENGYAGALSWTMTAHDGNGGLLEATPALESLVEKYAETLHIDISKFNFSPKIITRPNDIFTNQSGTYTLNIPVKQFVSDKDDSTFTLSITNNTNTKVASAQVINDSTIRVTVNENQAGISNIALRVADKKGKIATTYFNVFVYADTSSNLALYRKVSVSNVYGNYLPHYITDGKENIGWLSYDKTAWIIVEFEKQQTFNTVNLLWGDTYGRKYNILYSNDGINWQNALNVLNGKKGLNIHTFINAITAKYLKIDLITRSSNNGYNLLELQVYFKDSNSVKFSETHQYTVFPNPCSQFFIIETSNKPINAVAYLYTLQGQLIELYLLNQEQTRIDVSQLSSAPYILKIINGTNIYTKLINKH